MNDTLSVVPTAAAAAAMTMAGNNPNLNIPDGLLKTTALGGQAGRPAVLMEMGDISQVSRIIKFSINNVGSEGHVAEDTFVRIGSIAARKDAYENFNLSACNADNMVIKDQAGVGCRAIQAFSEYVCFFPVFTKRIKIFCDDLQQLNESLFYKQLQIDGVVPTQRLIDLAYTQEKSDQRSNLIVGEATLLLNASRYFEYNVNAGVKVTFYIELGAIKISDTFTTFPSQG